MPPDALRLESSLLILVDFAAGPLGAVRSMPQAELRAAAGHLAQAAAILRLPVLLLAAPLPGPAGMLLPEVTHVLSTAPVIAHDANDVWEAPEFVAAVQSSGRNQLVFAGIATEVGVGLTALSSRRAGYQTAVLTDACGTISQRAELAAFYRLSQCSVILHSWSGFLGEVQRSYSAPRGPELLQIVASGISGNALSE